MSHSHLVQGQLFSKQFPQLHLVHLQLFITFKFYNSSSRLINLIKDTFFCVAFYMPANNWYVCVAFRHEPVQIKLVYTRLSTVLILSNFEVYQDINNFQ